MTEFHLSMPLKKEELEQLSTGDVVYLTGTVLTARDEAHARILELAGKGEELPFDLEGAAIYHCGPLMRQKDDRWEVVAAGPTTSARMSKMTPRLLDKYNVTALIGKGGMDNVAGSLKGKCVYLAFTGGCAALAAENIREVETVHWPDLGMPEAVWVLRVENFGPLIVGIDAKGNDLFAKIEERARKVFSGLR
ncbi:FumA C-terminus/TtdB family hydratase beta subunit [Methanolobus chelungpuianus]|uniref:Fumarate hydratase n=1 Tax=Methanolobus chelungpuianus TaxID=502115 RepID=A0AAE3H9Z7_9EURY|nr:FumA C-terminus/TtdB family hydratase beta subunit [Methanolobus chelungpuianus]MCQ6962249.1 fumarate hydratase [Methanolobus chelungpuianus]